MRRNTYENEKEEINRIAKSFSMKTGFNGRLEKYRILTIKNNIKGISVLDVGCADGLMAKALSNNYRKITAIDGSSEMIKRAKKLKLKNVEFIHTLFEEYETSEKYDNVILSDILEHIDNPIDLLTKAKSWVKNNGRIVILCPNANSVHRQIGVLSGFIKKTSELNEADISVGHKRVYDIELLKKHIARSKLKIVKWGGIYLKPLSNLQMDQLDDRVVDAFYKIGKYFPQEYLAEIFVQCRK